MIRENSSFEANVYYHKIYTYYLKLIILEQDINFSIKPSKFVN